MTWDDRNWLGSADARELGRMRLRMRLRRERDDWLRRVRAFGCGAWVASLAGRRRPGEEDQLLVARPRARRTQLSSTGSCLRQMIFVMVRLRASLW